jgi:hypothetical protein
MPLQAAELSLSQPAALSKEDDLLIITLKAEAEKRLRLKVVPVEKRAVSATRLFAGEVVMPLAAHGKTVAPILGGTLDEILRLADLQASADGRILQAKVQIEAAQIAVERAQKVLKAEAGSVRSVDEAKTTLALAQATLTTAQAQRDILGSSTEGVKRFWVRVAVYSGEAPLLNNAADAELHLLGQSEGMVVRPANGPATANALAGTQDWFYELPADTKLRAGERVAVSIPTKDSLEERLVVPFNAVLHDIHGGQWVYQQTASHTYSRRRVQVVRLAGKEAILTSGPAPGKLVVTDGAAELFGTEFMTGK